ncbi:MAG: tellurium resistance protein TehB [Sulfurimonas sp.]|nr:MAG: tellurium resistance protein TehB [Sulfurimonas sp.]
MHDDNRRWNQKYRTLPMPTHVSKILKDYVQYAKIADALDIACGQGRHSVFLAELGFHVEAVDISEVALSHLKNVTNVTPVCADLDTYTLTQTYDLIVNINYLDRTLVPQIKEALKPEGIIIFETFVEAEGVGFHQPSNRAYVLHVNELLALFCDLEIIYYEEKVDTNLRGENVKIASLVARKP